MGWNSNERAKMPPVKVKKKKVDMTEVTRLTARIDNGDDEVTIDLLVQGKYDSITDVIEKINKLTGKRV